MGIIIIVCLLLVLFVGTHLIAKKAVNQVNQEDLQNKNKEKEDAFSYLKVVPK
jgi:F0F1-type ATP synthase assembly protein I